MRGKRRAEKAPEGWGLRKPLTRRQALAVLGAVVGVPLAVAGYGCSLGRNRLRVTQLDAPVPGLTAPVRAVLLSDLHYKGPCRLLDRALSAANDYDPDLVFVTGDLVETKDQLAACLAWIGHLRALCGVFVTPGNWDHWSGAVEGLHGKVAGVGARLLNNEWAEVSTPGGPLVIVGIDDVFFGNGDMATAFAGVPADVPVVALCHTPMAADLPLARRAAVMFSGHTHGGQVRLPIVGALTNPPGSAGYSLGAYETENTLLYVNPGLGTSVFPIRLNCPAEVTCIKLVPE